ncbi:MAG: hypothetical protein J6K45_04315 [Clostridia bacterium]|nr:hypothetical protein [Clostridia bacterium]
MVDILLSFIIYILGIFTGIIIPIVVYKYCNFFDIKTNQIQETKQENIEKPNNVTADLISEWQTGEVVGDNDE